MSDETTVPAPPVTVMTPTVVRRNLRDEVEDVFFELGGSEGMIGWVKESTANKRIFYKDILPKLIPKHVDATFGGKDGGPMRMVVEWAGQTPDRPQELQGQMGNAIATIAGAIAVTGADED